jgi:four helix bundle protein
VAKGPSLRPGCVSLFRRVSEIGTLRTDRSIAPGAVSIPANIAEGFRRLRDPGKVRMLNISQGSLEECRYYLILARDLGYGESEDLMAHLVEVSKMLDACAKAILTSDS